MKKNISSIIGQLAVVLTFTLFTSTSNSTVIDFELKVTDEFTDPIISDGFVWDFSASGWFIGPADTAFHPNGTSNGTSKLVAAGDRDQNTARVTMTANGGGPFDLYALDAAAANMNEINSLHVNGFYFGGGSISTTLNSIDATFDNYLLSGFVNLTSVIFSSVNSGSYNNGGFSIDNLNLEPVTPVPEPLTIAFLGLGLAGMGISYRKKLN